YKNLQGDVIAITDDTGATVARYTYDAWGKVLSVTDANGNAITSATHVANINPFRYRSYYYDAESRLYYLQSRYYDPEVGRFLNADNPIMILFTTINGHNAMCYCSNTPIIKTDSYGAFDESLYGFKLFDGTDDGHGKGFEIYMDPIFKSPDYCLSYAGDFLKKYGSGWWIFKKYDGMGIERIAAEIWFHAVVYYIGPYVKLLLSILGISKSAFDSIYKSSNPATINSKDNRELFFWIVWNARWLERFLRSSVSPKGCMNPFRVVFKQMIK
ncbi:MAG: RHS repeat-associated core domain-containing protein, partial [Clostridia bacterium]|nr:RHS repeat-associated core domain-containing protein [Clostridia bacterium]